LKSALPKRTGIGGPIGGTITITIVIEDEPVDVSFKIKNQTSFK